MFIAHRGLVTSEIKENTIEAFKAAINSDKYIGFEMDVRTTKDNELVVYHDLLYRGKLVKNTLYKELKKDNIPRLLDVLKLDTNKIIMIEIKDYNINLKKIAQLLNKYNYKNIYVMSFNNGVLKELKKYLDNIKIGSLNYVLNSEDNYSFLDFICLINCVLTEELINYFVKNDIEIFAYGVKDITKIIFDKVKYIVDEDLFK